MLKVLQASLQQYVNWELQMYKLDLENAKEPEIKLPTFFGSERKQGSFRKTSTSTSLTVWKPLTMCITTKFKFLREMGIPDHLTCLLRNLCMGQEATVRNLHGTTDWFKIGKGILQGCILWPYLFNLYAECACLLSHFSHVQLSVILWTMACQAPLSVGFFRQEYWIALPCLPPGDLPNPGIEFTSLKTLVLADGFFTSSTTWEAHMQSTSCEMLGWMNHKQESRSPGEISTISGMQMIPL